MTNIRDHIRNHIREHLRGHLDGLAGIIYYFFTPLTHSIIPTIGNAAPAFSRSTTGTVIDFEGVIHTCKINESRFTGARRVENLCASSEAYSTETITVVNGIDYIFSMEGSGSVTFSGAATGTLNGVLGTRVQVIKTTSSTSLTITVTGSVLKAQLEQVVGTQTEASEYVSTGELSPPYHGCNVDRVKYFNTNRSGSLISDSILKGYLTEKQAKNLFLNSSVPANQSITVVNATNYTLRVTGTGSITASGGGSGVASEGSDLTFTSTSTSVTLTIAGSTNTAQFELGNFVTSFIETAGTSVTRTPDELCYDNTNNISLPNSFSLIMSTTPVVDGSGYGTGDFRIFASDDTAGSTNELRSFEGGSYGYGPTTGGGTFTVSEIDIIKDIQNKYGFLLFQDGADSTAKIFLDGIKKHEETNTQALTHSDISFCLGFWGTAGTYYTGNIKDVKIFKEKLADAEMIRRTT